MTLVVPFVASKYHWYKSGAAPCTKAVNVAVLPNAAGPLVVVPLTTGGSVTVKGRTGLLAWP